MNLTDIVVVFTLTFFVSLTVLGFYSVKQSARKDKVLTGLVVIAAIAVSISIYGDIFRKMAQHPVGYVRTWNLFHHYLGAKYFPELGYFNLYGCALAADTEMQGMWDEQTAVRNLTTYTVGKRQNIPPCPVAQFSTRRWAWFRSDLLLVQQTTFTGAARASDRSPQIWRSILTDKGFNPGPVWATLGWQLTNIIPLDSGGAFKFLLSLDAILIVISLGVVGWVFGWETAALILVFLVTFWGSYQRLAGNVIQYDWLFTVFMGFCFWKLGWLKTSAAFFAYAITTRLFPVFFLAGLLVRLLQALIKRESTTIRPLVTFFIWVFLFCGLLFLKSLLLPNGFVAWPEFYANMQRHGTVLHQEMLNVGLKNLISTCCDVVNTPDMFEYGQHLADRFGVYYLLAGSLLALFAAYSLQRKNSDLSLMSMGYIPMFALVSVSRYYYIGLAIMMLPHQNRRVATIGLLGTNLAMYIMRRVLFTQDETLFYSFWIIQIAYLLFFAGVLLPWSALKPFTTAFTQHFTGRAGWSRSQN